jgi:pyruvate/2-oxoglutarate dehydrogenase complex dihydrolipoamide acyltransferase (E2) component
MSRAIPVVIEHQNVNDETVILTRWFVSLGAPVQAGQLIAEIETSKATVEIHSPAAGFVRFTAKEGDEIAVGQELCSIVEETLSSASAEVRELDSNGSVTDRPANVEPLKIELPEMSHAEPTTPNSRDRESIPKPAVARFSRRAAELAQKYDLKPEMFVERTLVREQDVWALLNNSPVQGAGSYTAGLEVNATIIPRASSPAVPHRVERLSARKRAEIRQISLGAGNSVMSYVTVACHTRGLKRALQRDVTLAGSTGAVVVFEVSRLLRKHPTFNAVYRSNEMCVFDQVNIGFAIDDGRGLKVPVIRQCDQLALSEVSTKMREHTIAYLEDRLSPEDLSGGTFTVSDLSAFDVTHFSPLISGDQSAILGIGSEVFLPDAAAGLYHLTLAFDHQLSDGRTAALFLNELRLRLEAYESALGAGEPDEVADLSCTRCMRSAKQLADLGGCLLRSAFPDGYVCSVCILGY